MQKGIAFVVTVPAVAAAFLTDPAQDLATRAGCLAELVESRQAKAGGSRVRRGERAVKVLAVMFQPLAYHLLAVDPRKRCWQLACVVNHESFLFCGASLAAPDAPAVAYCGVPVDQVRAAEASLAALEGARYAPAGQLAEGAA